MEKLNLSADSSSDKCPSPPPCDHTQTLDPIPINNTNQQGGGESSVKSPWQVLEELAAAGDHNQGGAPTTELGDESRGEGSVGGGAPGGGDSMVEEDDDLSEVVREKKRKTCLVRDPPSGKPTCPLCLREFPTWKGAFGHMRAHPDRDYRGFFHPPVFASPSSIEGQPPTDHKVEGGDDSLSACKKSPHEFNSEEHAPASLSSPIPVRMFDLNEPGEEEGPHDASQQQQTINADKAKDLGFDLNQLPPAEE
ncbi:hypothetical protein VNO78_08554 [Psophocarpus tetragonolobus]|uniref:C2H2-type domain-containing protein n=1 Tax=Psophocarpus tetragonolobus TaxID=3891 RepID=A0AAN9SV64_PSOTE